MATAVLAAFSGCSKDSDYIPPNNGGGNGGGGTPPEQFAPINCFNATSTDVSVKQASNACMTAPGTQTWDSCFKLALNDNSLFTDQTYYGLSSLLCQGASNSTPISCINNNTTIAWYEGAVLCSNAKNTAAPTDCWVNADPLLTDMEAALLCTRSNVGTDFDAQDANACFNQTSLWLDEEFAAKVCSQSNQGDYTTDAGYEAVACLEDIVGSDTGNTQLKEVAAVLCQKAKVHYTDATTYNPQTEQCYIDSATNQANDLTDYEAAILCSGAGFAQYHSGADWAVSKCYGNSDQVLSYEDAAILCSGANDSDWNKPNRCFAAAKKMADFNGKLHDAAVLCSNNSGIFLTEKHSAYQNNNRIAGNGRQGRASSIRANGGIKNRGAQISRIRKARVAYRAKLRAPAIKTQVRAKGNFQLVARKQMGSTIVGRRSSARSMGTRSGGHASRVEGATGAIRQ